MVLDHNGQLPIRSRGVQRIAGGQMLQQIGLMPKKPTDPLALFRTNLLEELGGEDEINMKGASTDADLGATYVRDVLKKGRDPALSAIIKLAKRHGLSIDQLAGLAGKKTVDATAAPIFVIGEVSAGTWREADAGFARDESPFPPDGRYPISAQFDLIVRGTSINRFG